MSKENQLECGCLLNFVLGLRKSVVLSFQQAAKFKMKIKNNFWWSKSIWSVDWNQIKLWSSQVICKKLLHISRWTGMPKQGEIKIIVPD